MKDKYTDKELYGVIADMLHGNNEKQKFKKAFNTLKSYIEVFEIIHCPSIISVQYELLNDFGIIGVAAYNSALAKAKIDSEKPLPHELKLGKYIRKCSVEMEMNALISQLDKVDEDTEEDYDEI